MSLLDLERLQATAQRYKERLGERAESFEIISTATDRSNYLARKLTEERAKMLSADATAKGEPPRPDETFQQIAQERLVGSSELVDINFLELALAVGRGVARLKIRNELATGVLVGPGLIMTNNHVIDSDTTAAGGIAQFDYQDNARMEMLPVHEYRMNPAKFFWTDKTLDVSLVALEPVSGKGRPLTDYPWAPLIEQTGKAENGDPVNIIQHPGGRPKQISFRENRVLEIPKGTKDFLYYTSDTEQGSSGSPCFNDQWELIALHHSGVADTDDDGAILKRDKTVWRKGIDPEGLINWIANEGARISAIVGSLKKAELRPDAASVRDRMLGETPPNPIELARKNLDTPASPAPSGEMQPSLPLKETGAMNAMSQSVTLTVPLQITFSIGGASAALTTTVSAGAASQTGALIDDGLEVTIDQNWADRKGYDPAFLGINVSLPKLTDKQKANTVVVSTPFQTQGDKNILNYHHYSVKMNKSRRSAWFSAGMIDGTRFIDFKRGKDKWFLDPRIDTKFQMGEELYAADNTDRGHLTRFKDLSWGANMAEAVNGTNDSFHFTNAALQLSNFNQTQDRWQGLEQFLLEKHAKQDHRKMVVITGPVFKSSDPKYRNPSMNYTAQIPLAFWKVCVLKRKDGSMAATAFTLGQEDITALPGFEEKLDIAMAQITVADLEALTGLNFGDLRDRDVFAQTGGIALEALRPGGETAKVKPIETFDDIVI